MTRHSNSATERMPCRIAPSGSAETNVVACATGEALERLAGLLGDLDHRVGQVLFEHALGPRFFVTRGDHQAGSRGGDVVPLHQVGP